LIDKQPIPTAVVRNAVNGDTESKAWLYQQYSKAMFNICIRMTGNRNNAEDILQDAFIQAFNNLHQLKEVTMFGGWLKRIVVNECIKQTKKTIAWADVEQMAEEPIDELEDNWWQDISLTSLHLAIKNLPNGCRQVFTLYSLENFSHKQIAENLGISEGTSKSQYHRAKGILKQKILAQIQHNG
jgi:RNA polymerase sigma factor (sigma-70 family)